MKIKKIKRSITENEYRILVNYTKGDDILKLFSKERFLMIFCLLYYTGVRLNELRQLKYSDIGSIIKKKEFTIITQKTKSERILYFSDQSIKDIIKYFDQTRSGDNYIITSWNKPKDRMNEISLINI